MDVLSYQTIHACFAVAFRTQASTRLSLANNENKGTHAGARVFRKLWGSKVVTLH